MDEMLWNILGLSEGIVIGKTSISSKSVAQRTPFAFMSDNAIYYTRYRGVLNFQFFVSFWASEKQLDLANAEAFVYPSSQGIAAFEQLCS